MAVLIPLGQPHVPDVARGEAGVEDPPVLGPAEPQTARAAGPAHQVAEAALRGRAVLEVLHSQQAQL